MISFEAGLPVAVNGKKLAPVALIETLNAIGGRHGVGRVDLVENRLIGIKSRGVYETPGGTLLVQALRALETLTLDRDSVHEKEKLAARYAELVYFGQWFSPLREALDAFMNALMPTVTGDVTLKLFKGSSHVVGPHVAVRALLDEPRVVRHARLHARGRRRLHPALRPAHEGPAPPQAGHVPGGRRGRRLTLTRKQLWGGRFAEPPAQALKAFNDSFSFDRALLAEDVRGSIGWAQALGGAGVLTPAEVKKLVTALEEIAAEAARSGVPADADDEDVHSFVEARLAAKVGPLSGKLHTGRSRNDQVATDFRLYVKDALAEGAAAARALALALARRAEAEAATPMPGYTHMKRAEPVTFGHWCLAYVEMLQARRGALRRGALARRRVPARLGRALGHAGPRRPRGPRAEPRVPARRPRTPSTPCPTATRPPSTSSRRRSSSSTSRASPRTSSPSRRTSSGSPRFRTPSRRAPRACRRRRTPTSSSSPAGTRAGRSESSRASSRSSRACRSRTTRTSSSTRSPCSACAASCRSRSRALTGLVDGLRLDRDRMAAAASDDRLLATELADALAKRGIPFREAHEIVGRRIAEAEALGVTLAALGPKDEITEKDLQALDVRRALAKRDVFGGTSPRQVARAARAAVRRLSGGAS